MVYDNENELEQHQLLEICGVKIFKKIQRKKVLLDVKSFWDIKLFNKK